jgi:hypothetical protein
VIFESPPGDRQPAKLTQLFGALLPTTLMVVRPELWSYLSSRRVLARLFSIIFCSIILVIHPLSKYGGASAFLALTVKELVFSVQENLTQQLEVTVLHSAGGLAGIGLSVLGKYFALLAGNDTITARAVPQIFLVGICFFGEYGIPLDHKC